MTYSTLCWTENQQAHTAQWLNDPRNPAPARLMATDHLNSREALRLMHQQTGIIWRGDYHQGKQLLAAIKKQVRTQAKTAADFHRYRLQQLQHSRLFQLLLVEIQPGFRLDNPRAPDISPALTDIYPVPNQQTWLMPLHLLLGYIGAHEWHKTGVVIEALDQQRIHVPFGVFSPLRGEYLTLVANAALPDTINTAWDIGTGSGVLAAILARRGIPAIIGTDTNERAIDCARANIQRLGYEGQVTLSHTDLFPAGQADLIVCNPPWLPAKAGNAIEAALYDPQHHMLKAFLQQVSAHLNPNGQVWLIMSDLAEHLGLRAPTALPQWIEAAGLHVLHKTDVRPQHPKAQDSGNALFAARQRETTSLWQLVAN
ncbi:class I SAM-dependent methyltransferase [Neisseriaceae bacterium ESL0693]|nr:class I SAM-dependent methyltransferase [Neisseriaceae bacterium ESL0693]